MATSGFAVTLLEQDFTTLRESDGQRFNVVMVGQKPGA